MYPIFLNVKNKLCVVVGGGKVAERKIKKLLREKAQIIVIAKSTNEKIKSLEQQGKIKKIVNSEFTRNMIPEGTFLVFECTGDKNVAIQIKKECQEKRIPLNSATYPEISDFFVPSSIKRWGLHISISTEGKSSAFSRAIREKIEREIPKELSEKLKIIAKIREKLIKTKGKKNKLQDKFLLDISRYAVENPKISKKTFLKYIAERSKNFMIDIDVVTDKDKPKSKFDR